LVDDAAFEGVQMTATRDEADLDFTELKVPSSDRRIYSLKLLLAVLSYFHTGNQYKGLADRWYFKLPIEENQE
jgi:hypothetical protein